LYAEVYKDGILISEEFSSIILNLDRDVFGTYTFVVLSSCGSAYATTNVLFEG